MLIPRGFGRLGIPPKKSQPSGLHYILTQQKNLFKKISIPNKTETLPIAVFMRLSSADIEGTVVMILLSVIIGLGVLHIYKRLSRQKGIPHA